MNRSEGSSSPRLFEIKPEGESRITVRVFGRMDETTAGTLIRNLSRRLKGRRLAGLTVDLEEVDRFNEFGVLVLIHLRERVREGGGEFELVRAGAQVRESLETLDFDSLGPEPTGRGKKEPPVSFVRLGAAAFERIAELDSVIRFIGSVCISLAYVLRHPRSLRGDDTLLCMQKTGVEALPIVGLISFLLGLIMAFMSAVQLEQFGANVYVASLVALAMTRELGPIMTAIIVAGRSGSAFAAEIGTMKISDEVDALFTMGFDPIRFLVVPKIVASVVVVPFLALFSDLFAMLGGLVVAVSMLDLTLHAYVAQTAETLGLFDVFWGFFKSGVFALLIAWVSCLRGFQVSGGAASVGRATTSAVVSSIFLIILSDSMFTVILRYWG